MSNPLTQARPYAKALFQEAECCKCVEAWWPTLEALSQIAEISEDFVSDPRIAAKEKVAFFCQATQVPPGVERWLNVLAENERLPLLPWVKTLYHKDFLEFFGKLEVEVESAYALPESIKERLKNYLGKRYDRVIELVITENKALIGGLRMKIGDQVIDCSLRRQLTHFRKHMKNE